MPADVWLTSAMWKRTRLFVLDRDRWRCQVKGDHCQGWANQVDHVIPRADGGAMFEPSNLRACCGPCNRGRSASRTNDMRRGRLTYRTTVPTYDTRL